MLHQAKKKKGALRHCFSPLQPDMIDFSGTVGLGTMHRGGVAFIFMHPLVSFSNLELG